MQDLSRPALQAVVAHELAHLVAGDARTHASLGAVAAGLSALTPPVGGALRVLAVWMYDHVGYAVFWASAAFLSIPLFLMLGVDWITMALRVAVVVPTALLALGGLGRAMAHSINLVVSRQTEYGADALAVELTRHPDALAEALRAVRDAPVGGLFTSPATPRLKPFFFARPDTEPTLWGDWLVSHPAPAARLGVLGTAETERRWRMPAGTPAAWPEAGDGLSGAGALLDALPDALTDAAHDLGRVEALAYAMLLLRDRSTREAQLARVPDPDEAARLYAVLDWVPDAVRLHLVQLALPTLRRLGSPVRARILDLAQTLVRADGRVTVRELALSEALRFGLEPPDERDVSSDAVRRATAVVLDGTARTGSPHTAAGDQAFARGADLVSDDALIIRRPRDGFDTARFRDALGVLSHAPPRDRERVLDAVLATVAHDGITTQAESDIVRLLALTLDLPCPPEHDALRALDRERRERIQAELTRAPIPD